ncbi:hypothetical protein ABZP36_021730 [Zizania latifolia]
MDSHQPEAAGMGSPSRRPLDGSCFILATDKLDSKVECHSKHSFVAWQTDVQVGQEKYDVGRFYDDFRLFFGLNCLRLQVTSFYSKDFLVTCFDTAARDVAVEAGSMAVNGHVLAPSIGAWACLMEKTSELHFWSIAVATKEARAKESMRMMMKEKIDPHHAVAALDLSGPGWVAVMKMTSITP